jgi:ABC-type multidrug transport system ATPase subunit
VTLDFDSITLAGVSRHFGRRRAVSHVSLTARAGEILGLLGPNGAGKSTLLGMLATLVTPSSGDIRYGQSGGRPSSPALRQRIGLLAHELHLYSELSARQNLTFFAELYGVESSDAVGAALHIAGLADRADDSVSEFSRGMRQRLALERALLHRPRLVLLDEPFTGLDDRSVLAVTARLRKLADERAIVILATHDLDLADGLITRAAVLREGRLVSDWTATAGLRARYEDAVGRA